MRCSDTNTVPLRLWPRRVGITVWSLLLVAGLGAVMTGFAAPPVPGLQSETAFSSEELQAKIAEIEASDSLDPDLKKKLVEIYRQALSSFETIRSNEAAAKGFEEAREKAPAQADELRRKLEKTQEAPITVQSLGITEHTPLTDLEQQLVKEQADLAALDAKLAELEKQIQDETDRPNAARERLTEAKQLQEQIAEDLKAAPPESEPGQVTEARRISLQLQRKAVSSEVHMLDQELLSYAPRLRLLKAQRDWTAHTVARIQERVNLLQDLVNRRRLSEAEQAKAQAAAVQLEVAGKHPIIRELAKRNAELTQKVADLAADLERTSNRQAALEKQTDALEQDFQSTRQKLDIAGLSESLGYVLIDQRRRLPDVVQYRKQAAERREKIAKAGLYHVQVDEELRELSDKDAVADRMLGESDAANLDPEARAKLRREVLQLLKDRRELLDKASTTLEAYLRALGDLDFAQTKLADVVRAYESFLDERLLWMPSSSTADLGTLRDFGRSIAWLATPANWKQVLTTLGREMRREPAKFAAAFCLIAGLVALRRRLRTGLTSIAQRVGRLSTDSFRLTVEALAITALLAVAWPALMAFLGLELLTAAGASTFVRAVGDALLISAPFLLNLEAFSALCASKGVAEAHFRWRDNTLRLLRHNLRWLTAAAVPAAFVAIVAARSADELHRNSLSRLAFVGIMVMLSVFLWRILNPRSGITRSHLVEHPGGWVARTRYLWYPVAIGVPLVLAGLALHRYLYTAGQLARHLINTLWLWWGAVLIHDLAMRWLAITRTRLAMQRARERRRAALAAQASKEGGPGTGPPPVEMDEVDLATIDAQTRRLVHILIGWSAAVGVYLIWADVFPAFGVLKEISVWQHSVQVNGESKLFPITLADLLLALVFGVVSAAAARNLPGVLEMAFLQKLSLTPGSRYAITTLSRYVIVSIGVVLVFNTIGGSWSQIQWLVAALGVGLGFGLQEIFANFMSGLIILFERPVRVGDTVTVGELTGAVTRIRIRATTITDWDRKEIVVPNKAFITERVINWTLSDPITRVMIPIGIAYGSDTVLAHRVMLEAVRSVPLVLPEPEPRVYFLGFGESSLDFRVYAFVSELANRLPLTHEVHMAIERALRENGIVIPFPQRDIHVRSAPEGWPVDAGEHPAGTAADASTERDSETEQAPQSETQPMVAKSARRQQ